MYQEVCFIINRGTEAGGGVNVGHSLNPPSYFMLVTGLYMLRHYSQKNTTISERRESQQVSLHRNTLNNEKTHAQERNRSGKGQLNYGTLSIRT